MSLSDLVNITISASTVSPTRPGFGTPLVAAYHTRFPERVRAYSSAAAMLADGFLVTDPAYLAVARAFQQSPSPTKVKVGRRALPPQQTVHLTVNDATAGVVYSIAAIGTTTLQAVTYTVPGVGGPTTSTVATAIAALITGHGVTASASSNVITLTPTTSNALFDVQGWACTSGAVNFTMADATADPGVATDLAAIWAADNDWYGLGLDSNSPAEILAAAAWTETNKREFWTNTSDYACAAGTAGNVMLLLQADAYTRTYIQYCGKQLLCYAGFGLLSSLLPFDPGSWTAMYKTIAGVPADDLTTVSETAWGNILAAKGNLYFPLAGLNTTVGGWSPSGEFMDLVDGIDWLQANLQIDVFAALKAAKKVPFTDKGVDTVRNVVLARLRGAEAPAIGLLVQGSSAFNAPLVANVSQSDRASRNLPGCTFSGQLAGAIHTLSLQGTLTV